MLRDGKGVVVLGSQRKSFHILGIDDEIRCELPSYAQPIGKCWIAKKNVLPRLLHYRLMQNTLMLFYASLPVEVFKLAL